MQKKILVIGFSVFLMLWCSGVMAQTWSGKIRLTWSGTFNNDPDIAVDPSNKVHVVWMCHVDTLSNYEIYYKNSTDSGSSWSALQRLTWNAARSDWPSIASDSNNNIHLVWQDAAYGAYEVLYKNSSNGGSSWSAVQRLTWNAGASTKPKIAVDSNDHLHVVWADASFGSEEILYKKSTDGGATWSAINRLTHNVNYASNPCMAIDSENHIRLVWIEEPPAYPNGDVYFKRSQDAGATWSGPTRLTWNGKSYSPDIAINSNKVIFLVKYIMLSAS